MIDERLLRFAVPYAGLNRFRFEGSDLRPLTATPRLPNAAQSNTCGVWRCIAVEV